MKHVVSLALSFLALSACRSGLGSGPLDGRVFEVTLVGPDRKPLEDNLVFDGGRFESTACRAYGFRGGPYSGKVDGDVASFEAAPRSSESGTTEWQGAIRGGAIEGTMRWTDGAGKSSEFRFAGKPASGELDGQRFEGRVCEGQSESGDADTLVFEAGAFDSLACRAYGFTRSPYTATREGDTVRFTAVAINAGGETNRWEGTIRAGEVLGTMEHTSASGRVLDRYRFVAKLAR